MVGTDDEGKLQTVFGGDGDGVRFGGGNKKDKDLNKAPDIYTEICSLSTKNDNFQNP